MSRTIGHGTGHRQNGTKSRGYEYWAKRPGPLKPGRITKKITHSIERARNRMLIENIKGGDLSD
jgi:hypothetical protein